MAERSHDELKSLIAPFVLGAIPPDEEDVIRDHLRSCDECGAEAAAYRPVAARLDLVVQPAPLPGGFADTVLEQAAGPREHEDQVAARRRWWRPAALIAATLALAALIVGVLDLRHDLRVQQQVTAGLLSGEGLRMEGDGAQAAVVPTDEGSVFVADGLDAAPKGRIYQLWFIDDEGPTSGGTFNSEDGLAAFETERSLEGVGTVAVTLEPEGGSDQPTTEPLMASS